MLNFAAAHMDQPSGTEWLTVGAVEPEAKNDKTAAKGTDPGVVGSDDGSEGQKGAFMGTETQRDFSCLVLNVYETRGDLIPSIFFPLR